MMGASMRSRLARAMAVGFGVIALMAGLAVASILSGRDLGIMSWTARNAFAHFTDAEIADLYQFLRAYHGGGKTAR